MSDERRALVRHMVNRFLGWKLPATFSPDAGVSFKPYHPDQKPDSGLWPIGTNLLDATQAKAMVEHMLEGAPAAPAGMAVPDGWATLSNEAVLAIAPMSGNWSNDEVAAFCGGFRRCAQALTASPSAQAAPARGAMTEDEINDLARRGGFISQPAKLSRTVHLMIRAILAAHGIGTTAPAGGER